MTTLKYLIEEATVLDRSSRSRRSVRAKIMFIVNTWTQQYGERVQNSSHEQATAIAAPVSLAHQPCRHLLGWQPNTLRHFMTYLFFFLSAKDILAAITRVAKLLTRGFNLAACLPGGAVVEIENGTVLNMLGSKLRVAAKAARAAGQPSLGSRMARICRRHFLLQGLQPGRICAISDRR
jgi:hypothetical protein